MDDSFPEDEVGRFPGLSVSLVSIGSDLETSVDDSFSNLKSETSRTLVDDGSAASTSLLCDSVVERVEQTSVFGLSSQKQEEIKQSVADAKAAQREYLQALQVLNAVKTVIGPDSKLPKHLIEKVKTILLREDLKDHIGLENDSNVGVLGLKEEHLSACCSDELTEVDKKVLQLAVESQIIETARELQNSDSAKQETLTKLWGHDPDSGKHIQDEHAVQMASLRSDLNRELATYFTHIVHLDTLLESIVRLRTDETNTKCLKSIDKIKAKAESLRQQSKFCNAQLMSAIYNEDEHVGPALQRLERELEINYLEMQAEYSKLTSLRAAYERVQGPQFSKVLEEYRAVQKQITLTKYTLDNITAANQMRD